MRHRSYGVDFNLFEEMIVMLRPSKCDLSESQIEENVTSQRLFPFRCCRKGSRLELCVMRNNATILFVMLVLQKFDAEPIENPLKCNWNVRF